MSFLAFEHLFYGDAAVLGNDSGRAHFVEGGDCSLHEVVGVGRALALGKNVGDAHALEHGTHSATGLYTGTVRSGLEDYARAAELGNLLVGDCAFVHRHADKVLLGSLNAFGDSGLNFVGLAKAPAYHAVLVTYNDDGSESECAAALGYLGNAVDGHKAVLEFKVAGRFYSIVSLCHSILEFEAGAASGISEGFNAAVEEVAVTVEHYFGDACFKSLGGYGCTNEGCDFGFGGFLLKTARRGGNECTACQVVDELHVDLLVGAEYCHAGTLGGTGYFAADAGFDFIASLYLGNHDEVRLKLFSTGLLTGLATYNFAHELDTFALVGFGLAHRANLGAHLAEELFVGAFEDDERVFVTLALRFYLDFRGKLDIYSVGVAQRELEYLAGSCGAVAYAHEFHFFAIGLVYAFHHVVDKGAEEAVLRTVFAVVAGTGHVHVVVLYGNFEVGVNSLRELAVLAFDGHDVSLFINRHFYSGGNCYGSFTYS